MSALRFAARMMHALRARLQIDRQEPPMAELPKLELPHTLMSEIDALKLLEGHRINRDGRTMDPKAQLVGEFVKSIRVPGYFPPLPELRQQLVTMTQLMDEPAPALARVEDIRIPGPAGEIPARLYSPQPAGATLPALAYFHGGGWVQGDLQTHNGLCARLALWAGAAVVAIDYRLAPEHKFPAAVDDCLAAYRWLRQSGGELGIDTGRVAVGGDSAGGNLSAVVSQQASELRPNFQVLIYPALDFAYATASHLGMPDAHIIPKDRIDWYTAQYLASEADKRDPRASPLLTRDLAGQPPALLIGAGFDPLRDEAALYAEKLRAAGVDVQHKEWPGQIHGFLSMVKAIPQGLQCTREIADYMRRRFGQSGSRRAKPGA
jgi:acetyl esterase